MQLQRSNNMPETQPPPLAGTDTNEILQLRTENARLLDRQRRIMELIGTTDANHLVHDIRNVLNERELLRALADLQE